MGDAAGSAVAKGSKHHLALTATAVRMFKYLWTTYYEEFATNTRLWVDRCLNVVEQSTVDAARTEEAKHLQLVYTAHVIPDAMLALWNNGLGELSHAIATGTDPAAARGALVDKLTAFLVGTLLKGDAHPTLSRLFTFRACVDKMIAMFLLGMVKHVLILRTKPREEQASRLKKVLRFFSHQETSQVLRRASLSLQLTGGVEAFVSPTRGGLRRGRSPMTL